MYVKYSLDDEEADTEDIFPELLWQWIIRICQFALKDVPDHLVGSERLAEFRTAIARIPVAPAFREHERAPCQGCCFYVPA